MESKLNKKIKQQFLTELGENVRKIRNKKGLTQLDLALKINGDQKKISRIENGKYNIKVITILILANALEISIKELINIKNIKFYKKNIWEQLD